MSSLRFSYYNLTPSLAEFPNNFEAWLSFACFILGSRGTLRYGRFKISNGCLLCMLNDFIIRCLIEIFSMALQLLSQLFVFKFIDYFVFEADKRSLVAHPIHKNDLLVVLTLVWSSGFLDSGVSASA